MFCITHSSSIAQETELYKQDWIGLKQLHDTGRLELALAPGNHMRFSFAWFRQRVMHTYLTAQPMATTA